MSITQSQTSLIIASEQITIQGISTDDLVKTMQSFCIYCLKRFKEIGYKQIGMTIQCGKCDIVFQTTNEFMKHELKHHKQVEHVVDIFWAVQWPL